MSDEPFLSRWSRRKLEAKVATPDPVEEAPAQPTPEAGPVGPTADFAPAEAGALPPIESLTTESDFTPFMKAEVDPGLKRQAFKKLIEDPRFNVMDGLDVYIDDYSKADPLPEGWLEKMNVMKHLGIFKPAEDENPDGTKKALPSEPPPLQKPMAEQALADGEAAAPADTSANENLPSEVGKSAGGGTGL